MKRAFLAAGLLILVPVLLASCRPEEQGRITKYEPGVYQGKPDAPLSAEARKALRERGQQQLGAFSSSLGAGLPSGGGGASGPAASGPSAAQDPKKARTGLNQRLRRQTF